MVFENLHEGHFYVLGGLTAIVISLIVFAIDSLFFEADRKLRRMQEMIEEEKYQEELADPDLGRYTPENEIVRKLQTRVDALEAKIFNKIKGR